MNTFLAHPLVKSCELVPIYFRGKAATDADQEAIKRLIAYMAGQPMPKLQGTSKVNSNMTNKAYEDAQR